MPWEKQFDIDETLERAMQVFWRQGYRATSVKDLVSAMGIHPGSLYPVYGNKRALFIRALRHYEAMFLSRFDDYAREHSPRHAIIAIFEDIVADAMRNPDYSGCLLANTTLELAPHDAEVARIVATGQGKTERFFLDRIRAGQASKEIPVSVSPTQTARVLLGLLNGLRVLARGKPERPVLQALVRHAEACLA